ncbi:hypothetical protein [Bradyrhizobium sp. Ghvi]|uniref:hypothetical protein n=1 Tax=Bradyrhizobium sp. Ghvi TaxID=1855319 RepID=UPI000B806557|nr:hypothetical protein [Bradyrhizobium sp. Ghvi]
MSEYRRLQSLAERQAALASDAETRRALEAIADDAKWRRLKRATKEKSLKSEVRGMLVPQ